MNQCLYVADSATMPIKNILIFEQVKSTFHM